jgi:hypothetical protein
MSGIVIAWYAGGRHGCKDKPFDGTSMEDTDIPVPWNPTTAPDELVLAPAGHDWADTGKVMAAIAPIIVDISLLFMHI